ncbi:hypothetical protein [Aquitalea magnusonii]|uniref:Uncharacterized protein n=1 Tax=Aquitalea magnusonii TaxID=332411 RepID=A0A318JEL5_9NEIS|nr:hypothetical protein [Aquitalea magnusonii]PXX46226.1 hypothetical protein DFR38_10967 [Aquitalea magnusonii]
MSYQSIISKYVVDSVVVPPKKIDNLPVFDSFNKIIEYNHQEYTKALYELKVNYSKCSYQKECRVAEGYVVDKKIARALKLRFLASLTLDDPLVFHLTLWTPPGRTSPKGAFKAVKRCLKKSGRDLNYAYALEAKPVGRVNSDSHRDDGIHFQVALFVSAQGRDVNEIRKELEFLFSAQRGVTVLDNDRAVKITGGHYLKRSDIELLQGMKHIIGYIAKPKTKLSQSSLSRLLSRFGISEKIRLFEGSQVAAYRKYELAMV